MQRFSDDDDDEDEHTSEVKEADSDVAATSVANALDSALTLQATSRRSASQPQPFDLATK